MHEPWTNAKVRYNYLRLFFHEKCAEYVLWDMRDGRVTKGFATANLNDVRLWVTALETCKEDDVLPDMTARGAFDFYQNDAEKWNRECGGRGELCASVSVLTQGRGYEIRNRLSGTTTVTTSVNDMVDAFLFDPADKEDDANG